MRFRGADHPPRYWRPGEGEALAAAAGLDVEDAFPVTFAYKYPDEVAMQDAMLAAGGAAKDAGPEQEPALRAAIRASRIVSAISGARSASTRVVRSTFSRMSEMAFWLRSLSSSVRRSVRRWMRSSSSGALLRRAPRPPGLSPRCATPWPPCAVPCREPGDGAPRRGWS